MVTNQEKIDTDSPVVSNAIFQRSVEIRGADYTGQILNMTTFSILLGHIFLIGLVLSSPVEMKGKEKKLVPEVTTYSPVKITAAKNLNTEQVQSITNAKLEKPSTKKRNVPRLNEKNDYPDDDFYEGRTNEDYDDNRVLKLFTESSKNENSLFDSGKYRGNDYRYLDEESRKKRTASVDDIFRKSDSNRETEIRLTPEDLLVLATYGQQHRLYNNLPYGRWRDINNAIDLPEEESESEEVYDRPENFFDRYYDQRYQNWANMPRINKFSNHQGKSYTEYPKLRVPLFKRAIL